MESYCTILEHDTGDRDTGSAQSPNTLMEASVTFVDDCFVDLRITGWGAKGNYGSLIQEEEGPPSVFRYSSGID